MNSIIRSVRGVSYAIRFCVKFVFLFPRPAIRFLFCRFVFMVSEQAGDPASVQLAELQNFFQQAM